MPDSYSTENMIKHFFKSLTKVTKILMAVVTTDQNQTQCEPEPEPEDDVDATPIQCTDRFGDCGPTVRRRPRRAAALAAEDRLIAQALTKMKMMILVDHHLSWSTGGV